MMYVEIHVKYPLFLSQFNEIRNLLDIFCKKLSVTKFHENPCSDRLVVPCGRTDRQWQASSRLSQFSGRSKIFSSCLTENTLKRTACWCCWEWGGGGEIAV